MSPRARESGKPWRTLALVLCLGASLALSLLAYQAAVTSRLPDWVEMQEGPVAHGVDKFYRNAYFKGNIETAGDATVAGTLDVSGVITLSNKSTVNILSMGGVTTGTITMTQILTPALTLYQLDPAASHITITLAPCDDNGQLLMLYNTRNQTVTIADSNIQPSGIFTLDQYDLYIGLCDRVSWLTLQKQDN